MTAVSEQYNSNPHYVGIGASAGGLEAITAFFKHMPVDSGLTFIVIQHLSPDYKSMMDELLSKVTEIPVQVVVDGMATQPNNIYLIPPRKIMTIFHGKLLLSAQDRSTGMANLPIDLFFHSLAEDQGCNAIGIILSGTGSDGTSGCRAIKETGGLVMVQSEMSAKFDGMPKSVIVNDLADFILPVEELPAQLLKYVNHPIATKQEHLELVAGGKSAIAKIFAMLRAKSKIDFTFYKPPTITRRIERRMSINQVNSLDEYVEFLALHPQEQTALYRELLIGVTSFWRDEEVFDALRYSLLREYIQGLDREDLRIWVAGCSTGEEAYTYGMLCLEICADLGKSVDVKIFATDIDQNALGKAGTGCYPDSIASDIPKELLNKHFIRRDDGYQVQRHLREMVVFARHDLIKDPPFTNIDMVSCRNLLIYLQPILQRRIFDGFNFSLKPGGLLVLGNSESLGDAEPYFDTLDARKKIYKSHGNRKPLLTSERFAAPDISGGFRHNATARREDHSSSIDRRVLDSFIETIAGSFLPLALIVDETNELVRVVGDPRHYLRPLSGKVSMDIAKNLVKDLTVPVTTGLTKVFKTRTEVSFSNVRVRHGSTTSKVNLSMKPLLVGRNMPLFATVLISEIKQTHELLTRKEGVKYDADMEIQQRVADLEQELQFTRENLQATIEELETSNEELQATNEELLASNEELQSTNEELQSVNEELFTVNSEYQGKISELSELNADMDNFMASSRMIALFLDMDFRIRKFSSNASSVFNVLDHDVGRPFEHISHRFKSSDLLVWSREVAASDRCHECELQSDDGDWYHLRILPYMLSRDARSGVVVVLHEINALKAVQEELQRAYQRKQLAQNLTNVATFDLSLTDGRIVWTDNAEAMLGLPRGGLAPSYAAFLQHAYPEDRVALDDCVQTAIRLGSPFQLEFRVVWPDHSLHWMYLRCAVLQDSDGNTDGLLGVMQNIDQHRANVEKNEALNRKYRQVLSALSEGVCLLDRQGEICLANAAACRLLGFKELELVGRSLCEALGSDGRCGVAVRRAMETEQSQHVMDACIARKDGTRLPIEYTISPMYANTVLEGVVVTIHPRRADFV